MISPKPFIWFQWWNLQTDQNFIFFRNLKKGKLKRFIRFGKKLKFRFLIRKRQNWKHHKNWHNDKKILSDLESATKNYVSAILHWWWQNYCWPMLLTDYPYHSLCTAINYITCYLRVITPLNILLIFQGL